MRAFAGAWLLAIVLWAPVAAAQSVVVLEFSGDKKFTVRGQVVKELQRAEKVKLVPLPDYKQVAKKRGLRGPRAMTPKGVAQISKLLPFDAAVEGAVGKKTFLVRILDPQGVELWSKELPLSGGKISDVNTKRLGAAIAAAVGAGEGKPDDDGGEAAESDEGGESAPEVAASAPAAVSPSAGAGAEPEEGSDTPTNDGTGESSAQALPTPRVEERAAPLSEAEKGRRRRAEDAEAHTQTVIDEDLEQPDGARRPRVGPQLITLQVAGTTTWRSYCSRPGVNSCREYDALSPEDRPPGDYYVDFSPQVPYAGFGLAVEFFPLSRQEGPFKGLGVVGGYSRGFSLTNVRVQSETSAEATNEVVSVDEGYNAQLTYRFYFGLGKQEPLPGYGGIRVGLAGRNFDVDPSANVTLHGSHRSYPLVGLDFSFPLAKLVRIEAGGSYFVNPKAGAAEIEDYGTTASGSGWSAEAGLGGDVWGPFGYTLRFKLFSYRDRFEGAGAEWPAGGAAQETYSGLYWGATAHF